MAVFARRPSGRRDARRRLVVWRTRWLPESNTFVRDQLQAYQSWSARSAGLVRLPDPLTEPDSYVFRDSRAADTAQRRLPVAAQDALASRAVGKLRPQLLHAHFGTDGVVARRVAGRLGIPLVVTFHGYDVTALDGRADYEASLRGLVHEVDLLIAVSDHIERILRDLGADPSRIFRHYTGVPLPPRGSRTSDRRGVLFVGRLVEKKGVADLLTAYAGLPVLLRSQHPLTVVGDGPLEASLRTLGDELGIEIIFTGSIGSAEVGRLFERCAIACVPSKRASNGDTEGLPTVILEAAARNAPVVASVHAGNAEAVDDGTTGLLFPEGDVPALRERLARLLADPGLRADMGQAGRRRVEQDFDINAQARKLESAYDRLLG